MTADSLRIAIAEADLGAREFLRRALAGRRHDAVAVGSGRELAELCRLSRPDLIITADRLPDMDGVQAAHAASADSPIPVLLLSERHDEETLERAKHDQVFGYLAKPVTAEALLPAVALAMHRFAQLGGLRKEATELRQALEDRKVIEQAKGVVMRRLRLDEPDVVARLRNLATDRGWKIVDLSRKVLKAEEIFQDIERQNSKVTR